MRSAFRGDPAADTTWYQGHSVYQQQHKPGMGGPWHASGRHSRRRMVLANIRGRVDPPGPDKQPGDLQKLRKECRSDAGR